MVLLESAFLESNGVKSFLNFDMQGGLEMMENKCFLLFTVV